MMIYANWGRNIQAGKISRAARYFLRYNIICSIHFSQILPRSSKRGNFPFCRIIAILAEQSFCGLPDGRT